MKSRVITLSLPEKLLREIDRAAKRENRTRSELMREATRSYMSKASHQAPAWEQIFEWGEQAAHELGLTSEKEVTKAVGEWRHGKKRNSRRPSRRL